MDDLVVEQGLAEHLALAGVVDGGVDDAVAAHQGAGAGPQPLLLELLHLVDEALARLADRVAHRHLHLVEEGLHGVRGAHAELVQLLHDRQALGLHRHHDQRLVLVDLALAGVGEQAHPVGLRAVGRPHLAAVDHPVAADPAGIGLDRGDV